MFLSIILKFQVPDINVLLGIRKKGDRFRYSLVRISDKQHEKKRENVIVSTRKRDFYNI